MRVNRNRLDLGSLKEGVPCRIITGVSSVSIEQDGGSRVKMGDSSLSYKGHNSEKMVVTESERGRSVLTYWLDLAELRPCRMYTVTTARDEGGMLTGEILDETPDASQGGNQDPASNRWLARILGRGTR